LTARYIKLQEQLIMMLIERNTTSSIAELSGQAQTTQSNKAVQEFLEKNDTALGELVLSED
jgi:hypothetical protein